MVDFKVVKLTFGGFPMSDPEISCLEKTQKNLLRLTTFSVIVAVFGVRAVSLYFTLLILAILFVVIMISLNPGFFLEDIGKIIKMLRLFITELSP